MSKRGKNGQKARGEKLYAVFIVVIGVIVALLCLGMMLRSCARLPRSAAGLFEPEDAVAFELTNEAHEIACHRAEGQWRMTEDETFPVDQKKVEALLTTAAGLSARDRLPRSAAAADYGLAEPRAALRVSLANGEEKDFRVGNVDEAAGISYYMCSDSDRILTAGVRLDSLFSLSPYDLIEVPQAPSIPAGDVREITIVNHALSTRVQLKKYPQKRPDIDLSGTCTWFCTFPDGLERPANEDNLPYLLAAAESIRYEYCVGWNESDAYLTAFGFDDPELEVFLRWTTEAGEQTLDLILSGSTQGGAHYFARERAGRNVYLIPASVGMFFESAVPDTMVSKNPGYVGLDYVSAFRVSLGEKQLSGAIDRTGDPILYLLNGEAVDRYDFTVFYVKLFNLYGASILEEAPVVSGEPLSVLELELTGHETLSRLSYTLTEYDEEHYAFSTNGRAWMLMEKGRLDDLEKELAEYLH